MKIYQLSFLVLLLLFTVVSCNEDDSLIEENNGKEHLKQSNSTIPSGQVRFTDDYWDGLSEFTERTHNNEDLQMMEVNKSLYYSEAALGWRMTGHQNVETENIGSETLTYDLDPIESEGQFYLSGESIANFNNSMYQSIANSASDFIGDVIVKTIDLDWDISNPSILSVSIHVNYAKIIMYSPCSINFVTAQKDVNVSCKYNVPTTSGIRQIDNYLSGFNNCFYWPTQQCSSGSHQLVNVRTVSFRLPIIAPNGPVFGHVPVTGPGGCYSAPSDYWSKINDIENIYLDPSNNISSNVLLSVGADIVREAAPFSHRGTEWARYTIADCVPSCNPCLPVISKPTF